MRVTFLITLLISLALGLVYPACEYAPSFAVSDVGMSSLFVQPGDTLTMTFTLQSNETFSGGIEVYAEKDGFEFPLSAKDEYLVPGQNTVARTAAVGSMLGPGLYSLHVRAYGFDYSTPLIMEGEPIGSYASIDETADTIYITLPTNDSVGLSFEITGANGASEKYSRTVSPENGTALIEIAKCSNCKVEVTSAYGGGLRVSRAYGAYSEPYVRITEFTGKRVALETCAPADYEIYVNGVLSGNGQGIARVERELGSGYEVLQLRLKASNWDYSHTVDLSKIEYPAEDEISLPKLSPFTVRITSRDSLGRDAYSEGVLNIVNESGVIYSEFIAFTGEYEFKANLPESEYTATYNGKSASGKALPQVFQEPDRESEPEQFVPRDLVPALIIVLAAAVAVLVLVWVKRMKVRK